MNSIKTRRNLARFDTIDCDETMNKNIDTIKSLRSYSRQHLRDINKQASEATGHDLAASFVNRAYK
jgi:hypothetical protein